MAWCGAPVRLTPAALMARRIPARSRGVAARGDGLESQPGHSPARRIAVHGDEDTGPDRDGETTCEFACGRSRGVACPDADPGLHPGRMVGPLPSRDMVSWWERPVLSGRGIEPATGAGPRLVHLVAGSTRGTVGATTMRVPAAVTDLAEDTNFVFRLSGSLPARGLAADEKPKGRLPEEWEERIATAVMDRSSVHMIQAAALSADRAILASRLLPSPGC
jgi:hypothetical protein